MGVRLEHVKPSTSNDPGSFCMGMGNRTPCRWHDALFRNIPSAHVLPRAAVPCSPRVWLVSHVWADHEGAALLRPWLQYYISQGVQPGHMALLIFHDQLRCVGRLALLCTGSNVVTHAVLGSVAGRCHPGPAIAAQV